jgi:hypothetical protein
MKKLIAFICILICFSSKAQYKFKSLNILGPALTNNGYSLNTYTINGYEKNNIFIGLGTGFNGTRIPTIPIFLYIQKRFLNSKHQPYAYALLGPAIPVKTKRWKNDNESDFSTFDLKMGYIAEAGVGYFFKINKIRLSTSLGTNFKYSKATNNVADYICGFIGPCIPSTITKPEYYKYKTYSTTLKLGIFL